MSWQINRMREKWHHLWRRVFYGKEYCACGEQIIEGYCPLEPHSDNIETGPV
jgi:hypothetical protein